MGTPPYPPWDTVFYDIHEDDFTETFLPFLFLYQNYIINIFILWMPAPGANPNQSWLNLQSSMNKFHVLKWEFIESCKNLDYMDMKLTIKVNRITTDIYKKYLSLYLYIPPHSSQSTVLLSDLVLSNCYLIYTLCYEPQDIKKHLRNFYERLTLCGYKHSQLKHLFFNSSNLNCERISAPPAPTISALSSCKYMTRTTVLFRQR